MRIYTGNDHHLQKLAESAGFTSVESREAADVCLEKNSRDSCVERMLSYAAELYQAEGQSRRKNRRLHNIINATYDGMIAVDLKGKITLLNQRAEDMTGLREEDVLGKDVLHVMPSSRLPRILATQQVEHNQQQWLDEKRAIITTRIPLYEEGRLEGALGVFQDITEIKQMAEEVTSLKEIQQMLEAIIHSSDDAISVVDDNGIGLIVNPAYTRLTGLSEEQIVGQPAAVDISEGESMHMKVLETGEAVRGARMKVGPAKKDVVVNAAPVIVDGRIRGSVGVIHDVSEMEELTSELEQAKQIIRTLEAKYDFNDIAGTSEEIMIAVEQAKAAAKTPAAILIRGESGTGKELFAHAVHNESRRRFNKFVRVNCAAITENLLESELFGYVEGAFSGARRGGKKGLFQEADKGSIFLDEIGELSAGTQAKLLRALQEGEIMPVGSTTPVQVDVRIIAATNVDMEAKMKDGSFRSDLYYRLNRVPIHIPPLRERKEDIELVSSVLLKKLNQDYGRRIESISTQAQDQLTAYPWPGNVRELENVLGRAMIHMPASAVVMQASHLMMDGAVSVKRDQRYTGTLEEALAGREKEILQQALQENHESKKKTAEQLGISIRSLYYKLDKHQLA
ncbi:sigma-54 interaction domain-containing protein [Alkalicoccus chagannorensis]|uniref:sigma-54 interaction domain-containing protein n=1 Tax=Alkalicoccus chagannorensis TaxID=427072 RepID=UPI000407A364|nr:sigma-54-dependent Fis family transcriptional regulator [Alkalicoccus chagannorensis]